MLPKAKQEGPIESGKKVQNSKFFFFKGLLHPGTKVRIMAGGWEKTGMNYDLHRENYAFDTVEFIESGQGRLHLGGRKFPVGPGCFFFYRAGQKLRIQADHGEVFCKFWVSLGGQAAESFFSHPLFLREPVLRIGDMRDLHILFRQFIAYGTEGEPEESYDSCCFTLRLILLRAIKDANLTGKNYSGSYLTYRRCLEYMENHVHDLHSIKELAQAIHVDNSYLTRLFKAHDTESPYIKLVRLKMRDAAADLFYGDQLVKEVASKAGFNDQYLFSKTFKRVYGVSPSEMRKNFKNP
jgi:AraC-like DNA-binding protein